MHKKAFLKVQQHNNLLGGLDKNYTNVIFFPETKAMNKYHFIMDNLHRLVGFLPSNASGMTVRQHDHHRHHSRSDLFFKTIICLLLQSIVSLNEALRPKNPRYAKGHRIMHPSFTGINRVASTYKSVYAGKLYSPFLILAITSGTQCSIPSGTLLSHYPYAGSPILGQKVCQIVFCIKEIALCSLPVAWMTPWWFSICKQITFCQPSAKFSKIS